MPSFPGDKSLGSFLSVIRTAPEGEYFLAGDESIIIKSGHETHGLDYFFSGLLNKVVSQSKK